MVSSVLAIVPSLNPFPGDRPLNQSGPTIGNIIEQKGKESEAERDGSLFRFIPHTRRPVWSGVETPRPIIEKLESVAEAAATQRARASSGPRQTSSPHRPLSELIKPDLCAGRGLYAPRPRLRGDNSRNVKFDVV